jgi:hypothetical protein
MPCFLRLDCGFQCCDAVSENGAKSVAGDIGDKDAGGARHDVLRRHQGYARDYFITGGVQRVRNPGISSYGLRRQRMK